MGTDSKSAVQQPSSRIAVVSSSRSSKKKKSKSAHKTKHGKRSDSSSSQSSNDYERTGNSSASRKVHKRRSSKEKTKPSSTNENRSFSKKSTSSKKKTNRGKHDSSESPAKRNHRSTRSRSKSRSRSETPRSTERSSSRESSRHHKSSNRRSGTNVQHSYSSSSHQNFQSSSNRRYPQPNNFNNRGGRMMNYIAPPMMSGGQMKNHNGSSRRSDNIPGNNSPPQSLLGGYRPSGNMNFRGRGNQMSNQNYVHKMVNALSLLQQQQLQQKGGANKFANPNNPNNRFYQQFQDNYRKISSGQKVSNLYQASFPVQHIPSEMRFNFRLLGRNIFTASDEEEEKEEKERESSNEKRRNSSSSSSSSSSRDRPARHNDDEDDRREKKNKSKSKASPVSKRPSIKRNRTTSSTNAKPKAESENILNDPTNFKNFLADLIQANNPEVLASTLATAAAAVTSKRERTKKQIDRKVQKFKNYARSQQIQATAAGVVPQTNPDEVEKKIHGLARRLQMKTIGLHDDYEQQGIRRSEESTGESDNGEARRGSSASSSDRSRDKDDGSDASTNSQRQGKEKSGRKSARKTNGAGQAIGSSDSEQARSDGNDSDGSMLNLTEDLKPISSYVKDRERMLKEMFRCVRGHKLQAILPDALKTRSLDEIKAKCLDQLDILSKKRIRAILEARAMTSSSGTEDSSDEDDTNFMSLYPHLRASLNSTDNNANVQTNLTDSNGAAATTGAENPKKSLTSNKFRPVQMQAVSEATTMAQSNLSAPVVVGGDEDVNDYYEGFRNIKKLSTLRRNEQEDDFLPFPEQSGKVLPVIGSSLPKFEFKPITSLTHSQQAHLKARRAANRQQDKQQDVRQELEDLLGIDDFVLPDGARPLSSAELGSNEQRRYGLPPKLNHRAPVGPPKKGSLGDLLKRKTKTTGERSPSPIFDEIVHRRSRRRSRSLSSTGSRKWSRSSSCSSRNNRSSRNRSPGASPTANNGFDEKPIDLDDMNDLSKLLDLNEEDELLLLQIEVEQEEKNSRRKEKRRKKQAKKDRKRPKKLANDSNEQLQSEVQFLIENILNRITSIDEKSKFQTKRTFDQLETFNKSDDSMKKLKVEGDND